MVQEKTHSENEIQACWFRVINMRLADDKVMATRVKQDQTFTKWVTSTWEPILLVNTDLPNNWLSNHEVLVDRRMLWPLPEGGCGP